MRNASGSRIAEYLIDGEVASRSTEVAYRTTHRVLPRCARVAILSPAFLGVRLAFTYLIRQHLVSPIHVSKALKSVVNGFGQSNGGPPQLFASANLPNAWVYSTHIVDGSGHALTSSTLTSSCPDMMRLAEGGAPPSVGHPIPAPAAIQNAFQDCVTKVGATYHGVITYQPASRYWLFQSLETGIYVVAALGLAAFCFYWIRRRVY